MDLRKDQLYFHRTAQFNYTTYDVRRSQDSIKSALLIDAHGNFINTRTERFSVMLASSEDDRATLGHPFWYARVLAIFHVNVRLASGHEEPYRRLDLLWVRWLGRDFSVRGGWKSKRLNRVGYVFDDGEPGPFGFVNPADIIRSSHLIPAFDHDFRDDLLPSASIVQDLDGQDHSFFYVNRSVQPL